VAPALLDTNVLVHAVYLGSPLHEVAASLVDRALRTRGLYCISPQNLTEFAAVVSRPRFVTPALAPEQIVQIGDILYRSRRLAKIYPQRGSVMRAMREGADLGIVGPAWYDLYLAVTMRDSGVHNIVTDDSEHFRRFPFVNVIPLRTATRGVAV
jgi:predicted nucleic acid-binding protein